MRFGSIVSALFAVSVSATAANADWQYTKWGMTQSQVIAASKNEAQRVEPSSKYVCNGGHIPFASVEKKTIGQFTFNVTFCSDKPGGSLKSVRLGYHENVPVLKRALLSQYGTPVSDKGNGTIWSDQKSGNSIDLYDFGAGAILTYSSNKSGL